MPQQMKEAKTKAGRRGNNEGSIFKRKDGRWCGEVLTGYKSDGKPIYKTVYRKTQQEVIREVAKLTGDVFANGYTSVSAKNERNFEVLCREWFDLFVASTTSSRTEETRRYTLKNHIFPAFGKYDIKEIDLKRLQKFFNEKSKKYASDTVHKMKNLLNNFFAYAVEQNYLTVNPMTKVKIKKKEGNNGSDEKGQALKPEIREALLELAEESLLLKPIIITSSFTGLRPQEICALRWDNVSLVNKTISVKKAVVKETEFDEDWNVVSRRSVIGKTKTKKSVRNIAIPDAVVMALQEWLLHCQENDIKSEYVFPNTKTGEFRKYSGLRSSLERFKKKHGLEGEGITLYTFRHTFATVLLEERENPRIVADMMGHEKISTTLDLYSHVVTNSVYEQTAQKLDGVYEKLTKKKNPTSSYQPAGLSE